MHLSSRAGIEPHHSGLNYRDLSSLLGRSDVQAKTSSGFVCSEMSLLACERRLLMVFSNTSTYVCLLSSFKDTSRRIRAVS